MANINVSVEARNDMSEISRYITIELNSPVAAKNTLRKITKSIRNLQAFPDIGAPLASIIDFPTDYRFLVCGNYLVFYCHENSEVYIIRVLYGKRDYLKILFSETVKDDSNPDEQSDSQD